MRILPPPPYPMYEKTVAGGVRISYLDTGAVARKDAPTFLFLHGLGTYGLSWRHNINALQSLGRCIALDLPGHGFSTRTNFSFSMRAFAHAVIHLIGELGLQRVCLVGHSMGGQIAMTAVLEEPRCAERLLLCAPAGFETFNPWERMTQMASARMMDVFYDDEETLRSGIRASFHKMPADAVGMIQDLVRILRSVPRRDHRYAMERCIEAMMDGPVFHRLPQIQHPALVIFGEADALIPAKLISHENTRSIAGHGARRLPASRLHLLKDAGHFVHWEAATEVNRLVLDWFPT